MHRDNLPVWLTDGSHNPADQETKEFTPKQTIPSVLDLTCGPPLQFARTHRKVYATRKKVLVEVVSSMVAWMAINIGCWPLF